MVRVFSYKWIMTIPGIVLGCLQFHWRTFQVVVIPCLAQELNNWGNVMFNNKFVFLLGHLSNSILDQLFHRRAHGIYNGGGQD